MNLEDGLDLFPGRQDGFIARDEAGQPMMDGRRKMGKVRKIVRRVASVARPIGKDHPAERIY